ncbi:hypothetical protein BLOT_015102 [Blomia tropicalis]|nr:hypothetical protein BLOT_015102 [Blomia tropicalis]
MFTQTLKPEIAYVHMREKYADANMLSIFCFVLSSPLLDPSTIKTNGLWNANKLFQIIFWYYKLHVPHTNIMLIFIGLEIDLDPLGLSNEWWKDSIKDITEAKQSWKISLEMREFRDTKFQIN